MFYVTRYAYERTIISLEMTTFQGFLLRIFNIIRLTAEAVGEEILLKSHVAGG